MKVETAVGLCVVCIVIIITLQRIKARIINNQLNKTFIDTETIELPDDPLLNEYRIGPEIRRPPIHLKTENLLIHMIRCAIPLVIVGCLCIILRGILVFSYVESSDMEPTIRSGSLVVSRRMEAVSSLNRQDIVLVRDEDSISIYRIIGVPGDTVTYTNEQVRVNGSYLDEPYLTDTTKTRSTKVFTCPAASFLVLGDDRADAFDSRFRAQPYVSAEKIMGVVILTLHI